MALKFLNKKGWHTGSLRNIENVWKAEQKHEAEQKKLEELRKQILEEKERNEFRRLQEQAGLVPRQERLEFLYDSGLSVGKSSSDGGGFKSLEALPQATNNEVGASSSAGKQQDAVPGALFEEKQHSANDAWRKLHSDPLLMIRQREQDALARIKNNPVKMAMIRKSVESKKREDDVSEHKKAKRKHRKHSSSKNQSDSEDDDRKHRKHASTKPRSNPEDGERKLRKHASSKHHSDSEDDDKKSKRHSSTKYRSDSEDDARKHRKQASSKHRTDSEDDDRKGKRHYRSDSEDDARKRRKQASSKHRSDSEDDDRKGNKHSSTKYQSDSEDDARQNRKQASSKHQFDSGDDNRKGKRHSSTKYRSDSEDDARKNQKQDSSKHRFDSEDDDTKHRSINGKEHTGREREKADERNSRGHQDLERETKQQRYRERSPVESREERGEYRRQMKSHHEPSKHENPQAKDERTDKPAAGGRYDSGSQHRRRNTAPKLSAEERAAKLREMQRDAELHEELRWKRLKKVDETDAQEATRNVASGGKTFLDAAHKSVYGAEQGGSATIEESVRRRSHYLQSRSSATEGNAFRR